jgi:hypothetical protein
MTLEPSNSTQEEQISFTGITQNANGTATLTGVKTVLFISPYTETSGTAKAHPGGSKAVVSNTSGFYNTFANQLNAETVTGIWTFTYPDYPRMSLTTTPPTLDAEFATKKYVDDTTTFGAPDATTTVKGITKMSYAPASATEPISVGDNDPRVPTQDQNDALAGSSGTPSSTNTFVTTDDVSDAAVTGKIVRATGTKLPALFADNLKSVLISGLYIASQTAGDLITKNSGGGWIRLAKGAADKVLLGTATTPGIGWGDAVRWQYISQVSTTQIAGVTAAKITIPTGATAAIVRMTADRNEGPDMEFGGEVTIFKTGKTVGTVYDVATDSKRVSATWQTTKILIDTNATNVCQVGNCTAFFYK